MYAVLRAGWEILLGSDIHYIFTVCAATHGTYFLSNNCAQRDVVPAAAHMTNSVAAVVNGALIYV